MLSTFILILLIILLLFGLILAVIYWSLNGTLFYPIKDHVWEPTIPHDKLLIEDRISAWHFSNYPDKKTVLFCHGNYGNISYKDYVVEMCDRSQLNLLLFDYRGYGLSRGIPSQHGLYSDGECVYKYLTKTHSPDQIIIWGESLGGAVATHIASKHPCSTLILMSTFSSLDDVLRDSTYGFVPTLLAKSLGFLTDVMPSKVKIKEVKCPIVILHSPDDELIPFSNGIRLFESIPHNCKLFIEIKGAHGSPDISEDEIKQMFTFCCLDTSRCHLTADILEMIRSLKERYNIRI